jgi:hypothetical protein
MDSFESQIRFGITLSNFTHNENDTTLHGNRFLKNLIERAQSETKKKSSTNRPTNLSTPGKILLFFFQFHFHLSLDKPVNNRLDFLNYSLSLMRSMHEHGDQEPLIDVLSYKHLAYLLDSFIYYFRENGLNEIIQTTATKTTTHWKEVTDESSTTCEETGLIKIFIVYKTFFLFKVKQKLSHQMMFFFNVRHRHYVLVH